MFQALCSVLYKHSLISWHPKKWVLLFPFYRSRNWGSEKQTKICPSPLIYIVSAVQAGKPRFVSFQKSDVLSLLQESVQGLTWHSVALSPQSPLIWDSSSGCLLSWPSYFWRVLAIYCVDCPPIWVGYFLMIKSKSYVLGKNTVEVMLCPCQLSYQEVREVNMHYHQSCSFWSLG